MKFEYFSTWYKLQSDRLLDLFYQKILLYSYFVPLVIDVVSKKRSLCLPGERSVLPNTKTKFFQIWPFVHSWRRMKISWVDESMRTLSRFMKTANTSMELTPISDAMAFLFSSCQHGSESKNPGVSNTFIGNVSMPYDWVESYRRC